MGYSNIGLIPDFIGYILIGRGLRELEDEATNFAAAIKSARFMKIFSLVFYILDFMGLLQWAVHSNSFGPFVVILMLAINLTAIIMFVYITYLITSGVQEMEAEYDEDMNGDRLETAWKFMFGAQAVHYCCLLLGEYVPYLSFATTAGVVITLVVYLVYFFKSARKY